jgi:hypothetical protein
MRRVNRALALVMTLLIAACCIAIASAESARMAASPSPPGRSYEALWRAVDSLETLSLPRSAAGVVEEIYGKARADGAQAELVKALLFRSKYVTHLEEGAINRVIVDLRREIELAPPASRAILQSVLGEALWRYYEENRWAFHNRRSTSEDLDDLRTWSLEQLLATARDAFRLSVMDADLLQQTPVGDFQAILLPGGDDRLLRPTLYDFLAHRALDFLTAPEAGLHDRGSLSRDVEGRFLAPVIPFLADTIDAAGVEGDALRLFQELLAFRLEQMDPAPFIDVELRRLAYGRRLTTAAIADSLYLGALEALHEANRGHPASAEALYAIAEHLAGIRNAGNLSSVRSGIGAAC